jgi:ribosome-associated translation inhibitor RaiA
VCFDTTSQMNEAILTAVDSLEKKLYKKYRKVKGNISKL